MLYTAYSYCLNLWTWFQFIPCTITCKQVVHFIVVTEPRWGRGERVAFNNLPELHVLPATVLCYVSDTHIHDSFVAVGFALQQVFLGQWCLELWNGPLRDLVTWRKAIQWIIQPNSKSKYCISSKKFAVNGLVSISCSARKINVALSYTTLYLKCTGNLKFLRHRIKGNATFLDTRHTYPGSYLCIPPLLCRWLLWWAASTVNPPLLAAPGPSTTSWWNAGEWAKVPFYFEHLSNVELSVAIACQDLVFDFKLLSL